MDGTDNFVVVWDSDYSPTDSSSRSVHARRYSTAASDQIFADEFELGAKYWSKTVP
jgi:hypothetical protein